MKTRVTKDPSGLWRVHDVPIISTGIEYPLLTGSQTFTESQLASAIEAQKDPAIVEPRIKLGHTSEYNSALVGDAEQAFGRIDGETMKLGDNNQTLYADYLVPEWLGAVMAIAYPNRSIEATPDVETVTGKEYEMVINAVSLLGIHWPGCQVIDDLPLWYGGEIPEGVEFDETIAAQIAASRGDKILAETDISRIRQQFYVQSDEGKLDVDESIDTFWWWVRGERLADDGMYLVVEDPDKGDLYKFPVQLDGSEVTFDTPEKVQVEYVKAAAEARAAVVAGMAVLDSKIVVHASRAETGGPEETTQRGASGMDEVKRKKLAASCGLPEDATEEQITARVKQIRAEAEDAGVKDESTEEESTEESTEGEESTEESTEEESTEGDESIEAGTVTVDKATWEATRRGAELAQKHEGERVSARRKEKVLAAIKAGKIPPARRGHYEKLMALDEEGTTKQIDDLQAGVLPVGDEVGQLGTGDENDVVTAGAGLPDEWFPEIVKARTAARTTVTHAKEG